MQARLSTPICERLRVRYPLFGFSHSADVTIAIARAGGFGVLGVARDDAEEITRVTRRIRAAIGDLPFGVDLMLPKLADENLSVEQARAALPDGHKTFIQELRDTYHVPPATRPNFFTEYVRSEALFRRQVDAVLGSDVDLVATAIGVPAAVIGRIKTSGKTSLALVGAVKHAKAALAAGTDILVAQGYDAGGHTGTVGTLTLVPQIVEVAGPVPVLAAGGIGHGRQVAASFALGAQGAWLGTVWLGTREHQTHPTIVGKLLAAASEDTVISRAHSGKPCRVLKSAWSDAWAAPDAPAPLPMPYQQALAGEFLAAVEEHDIKPLQYCPAGQSVAWVNQVEPVAQVIERLVRETRCALEAMTNAVKHEA